MRKLTLSALVATAALAAPGAAQAACVPNTQLCVTGLEENVAVVVATANGVKTTAETEVNKALGTAWYTFFDTYFATAAKTRAASDAALGPVERTNSVCVPPVAGTRPICVEGVGATVVATETAACAALGAARYDVGLLTNRCVRYDP